MPENRRINRARGLKAAFLYYDLRNFKFHGIELRKQMFSNKLLRPLRFAEAGDGQVRLEIAGFFCNSGFLTFRLEQTV
jgi:hypothetical protein